MSDIPESIRCAYSSRSGDIRLFQGECLRFMDLMLDRSGGGAFDLIFADPPYFLSNGGITCHSGRMVKVDKGSWDRSRDPDQNHRFNRSWLERCRRLLKPDGAIWVSGTLHVVHSLGFAMQQLGFKLLNDITWVKPNPPPNLSCRSFTHATETLIWSARGAASRHVFNYRDMKAANGGKQMKSVWSICPPSAGEKQFGRHPTQKPLELLERILQASSIEGAWVLDPFAGSATTGVAARDLGRRFVGCELDPGHAELGVRRLSAQEPNLSAEDRKDIRP